MEKDKTIFDFLANAFCIYGITMAMLIIFALLFGESAKEISGLFGLGNKGIPLKVMAEFLLTSFLVTSMQYLFFSEKVFPHMSERKRAVCMLVCILSIISLAIWGFGWFPIDMWQPWVCFFLSFFISVAVSTVVMSLKTKAENRKLEEGLKRMKEKWNEEKAGEEE
ncbi:hypothetical protein NXH76_00730 [Blautia schinkii]|nr:hypothetical protein [Blautia schinkii]